MPTVPALYRLPQAEVAPLPGPRMNTQYQPSGLEYVGSAFGEVADVFNKMQAASDAAESGRLIRQTSADMQAAVKQAAIDNVDPMEFEQAAKEALQTIRQARLESASTSRVRQNLLDHIGDDEILRKQDIAVEKFSKMRAKAQGNWVTMKGEAIVDYGAATDPVEKAKIASDLGTTLNQLTRSGFMKLEEAQLELKALTGNIAKIDITQDFKNAPVETLKELESPTGKYARRLDSTQLDAIKDHLATSYRVAQADLDRTVRKEQDENFADAMVQARKPGGITQAQIDAMALVGPDGKRKIDASQAVHLTNQMNATAASGGVLYSNQTLLADMRYRAVFGKLSPTEVSAAQVGQQLTVGDATGLYSELDSRMRRDRSEAREVRSEQRQIVSDQRFFDISNDHNYKNAINFLRMALPNTDLIALDHEFRAYVSDAFTSFDAMAREVDPATGKPKYQPKDFMPLAYDVRDATYIKMDISKNSAKSKLLPGIRTSADVANAKRANRITQQQAVEQYRLLDILGQGSNVPATPTVQTASPVGRDARAKDIGRAQGAP